jgi:L-asparaginase II
MGTMGTVLMDTNENFAQISVSNILIVEKSYSDNVKRVVIQLAYHPFYVNPIGTERTQLLHMEDYDTFYW